jgi:hypothetical protein
VVVVTANDAAGISFVLKNLAKVMSLGEIGMTSNEACLLGELFEVMG